MPPQVRPATDAAAEHHPAEREGDAEWGEFEPGEHQVGDRQPHRERGEQNLQHRDLRQDRLAPQPALRDRGEVAAHRVATPAHALLDERAERCGKHRKRLRRALVHRAVPLREHEPGESPVVAGHAAATEEVLVLELVQHRDDGGPSVDRGASGEARHRSQLAHRRHVVVVAEVDHPVGDPAPDARLALVHVLLRSDAPDPSVLEGHLHGLQQARSPSRVGVDECDELRTSLSDSDSERRALSDVFEEDRTHPAVAEGDDAVVRLEVAHVEHDDDLVRLLRAPGVEALEQDVGVFVERRHDDRHARAEIGDDRAGGARDEHPDEPDAPDHRPRDGDRDERLDRGRPCPELVEHPTEHDDDGVPPVLPGQRIPPVVEVAKRVARGHGGSPRVRMRCAAPWERSFGEAPRRVDVHRR